MDKLELLQAQLNAASVADDVISRGVTLTPKGIQKLCGRLGVGEDELKNLLAELSRKLKGEDTHTGLPSDPSICEEDERFGYEADFMGNVTLHDHKTGAEHYLQGSDGAKFLHELERIGTDYQALIAPYFDENLMEFAQLASPGGSDADNGGTYNFPFQGNFAVARFWLEGSTPKIEIASVLDQEGNEVPLDNATKVEAEKTAWKWVNKV